MASARSCVDSMMRGMLAAGSCSAASRHTCGTCSRRRSWQNTSRCSTRNTKPFEASRREPSVEAHTIPRTAYVPAQPTRDVLHAPVLFPWQEARIAGSRRPVLVCKLPVEEDPFNSGGRCDGALETEPDAFVKVVRPVEAIDIGFRQRLWRLTVASQDVA